MEIVNTFAESRALSKGIVGFVPTMGFLHEGHLSLVAAARPESDTVLMSLYVNPLQFGETEDFDAYPRDDVRDASLAEDAGVDVLFAPEELFDSASVTTVALAEVTTTMEGRHRPGHFEGVATVVTRLFAGLQPDVAYFGRKDAQQLVVVRRLVADLSFPITIAGRPIVREPDGLALSSRNVRLSAREREAALGLSRGLLRAGEAVAAGERAKPQLSQIVLAEIEADPLAEPEYVELASQQDAVLLDVVDRSSFLATAVRVGSTRLIDNVHLDVAEDGTVQVDAGTVLEDESVLYRTAASSGSPQQEEA